MVDFLFILQYFGGLVLLTVLGGLIGHLFKLDTYKFLENNRKKIRDNQNDYDEDDYNEDDQNHND